MQALARGGAGAHCKLRSAFSAASRIRSRCDVWRCTPGRSHVGGASLARLAPRCCAAADDSSSSSSPTGDTPPQPAGEGDSLLRLAMLRLRALEEYQQLLASSNHQQHSDGDSSSSGKPAKKQQSAPRTPERVAAEIAADASGGAVPLLEAAILIARHAYPDLDAAAVVQQLDDLAAEVEAGLPAGVRYPLRVLKEVNRVLYEVHGFRGNADDYYSRDNSCINRVLETKTGIPISLSLVYMEVCSRLGLPMTGINLPSHYMLRPQVEGMEWLVDPFNGGELTALQDAEEMLSGLTGMQVKLDPAWMSAAPISSRSFLLRWLNNLRQTYIQENAPDAALSIVRYMQATAPPGVLPELHRDEGLILYALNRWPEATAALRTFLTSSPGPEARDTALVTALLEKIRERAAEAAAEAARGRRGGSSLQGSSEDV